MYVFTSVMDAVQKEDGSFLNPAKQTRPPRPLMTLMVASVLAWNSNRLDLPRKYGAKCIFSFIKVNLPFF